MYRPRWTRKPEAVSVEIVRVQPGDIIVARVSAPLSAQQADQIKQYFERRFTHNTVMVVEDKIRLQVIRGAA